MAKTRIKCENGKVLMAMGYTYDGKVSGWLDITESYNKNRQGVNKG